MKTLVRLLAIFAIFISFAFGVDINTASKKELMNLDGIGDKKADAIIEYRAKNKFKSIEDIKNVDGIGDKLYEKIKKDISVGQ
ncbi:DNA-binding protein [Helicobacter sp. 16-1353]|uniref:ComEA family DNA-binding protein n=1 Tax=Helicobacter sp. 16-1353 TaxID=2004996 RepID=UPI000DCF40D4|nr:helix-hairpin-helix domain-containing protein [Helicobacter sp. 16-1353]RAX54861.1 DNA-binding protein [Helicobacter sp. 16-1353]